MLVKDVLSFYPMAHLPLNISKSLLMYIVFKQSHLKIGVQREIHTGLLELRRASDLAGDLSKNNFKI
jgi:hypothetical protein